MSTCWRRVRFWTFLRPDHNVIIIVAMITYYFMNRSIFRKLYYSWKTRFYPLRFDHMLWTRVGVFKRLGPLIFTSDVRIKLSLFVSLSTAEAQNRLKYYITLLYLTVVEVRVVIITLVAVCRLCVINNNYHCGLETNRFSVVESNNQIYYTISVFT